MQLVTDFINNFMFVEEPYSESILKWFLEKGILINDIGNVLSVMTKELVHLEKEVEAYWILKAFLVGVQDVGHRNTIENLMKSIQLQCIEKSYQWLSSDLVCEDVEIAPLRIHLEKNIHTMLEYAPVLCSAIFNMPSDGGIQIGPLEGNDSSEDKGLHAIYKDQAPVQWTSSIPIKQITYGTVENGVCFYGMGGGVQILSLFNITHMAYPYPEIGFYIVEPSLSVFRANLAINDFEALFKSKRVKWYIGDLGFLEFLNFFKSEKQFRPSYGFYIDKEVADLLKPKVDEIIESRWKEFNLSTEIIRGKYENRTIEEWISIYSAGNRPIRVMGMTSLFTVYLQYCMRDWLDGFRELGCETKILIEKEKTLRLNHEYSVNEIKEFDPDLILGISYNRCDITFPIPPHIPFINWQQDILVHNRNDKVANQLGDRDFILANRYANEVWLDKYNYPKKNIYRLKFFPSNQNLYRPVVLTQNELEKYQCDVSFVSNCTKSAEASFLELLGRYKGSDGYITKLIIHYYEMIKARFEKWEDYPVDDKDYNALFNLACEELKMGPMSDEFRRQLTYDLYFIGDKYLRHKPLEILAQAGVEIALYGHGWEKHPALGKFARGIAENGEELNKIYNASSIVYHAISGGTIHPRFMDAMSSGSFVLVKKLLNDYEPVDQCFSSEKEFVYFDDLKEIVEKVKFYLAHPDIRKTIGNNAFLKAKEYSYKNFSKYLLSIVAENIMKTNI